MSVLFVCLGNICRSPMAEGALRHHAAKLEVDVKVDSAGTGDWHIGHPPDQRAQEVARRLGGIDISRLKARQVQLQDFDTFDHIVAMDQSNLQHLRTLAPSGAKAQLSLFLDHLPGHEGNPVPDPYYGDAKDFENVWKLIDAAAEKLAINLSGQM